MTIEDYERIYDIEPGGLMRALEEFVEKGDIDVLVQVLGEHVERALDPGGFLYALIEYCKYESTKDISCGKALKTIAERLSKDDETQA